jgi:hypothetical protein
MTAMKNLRQVPLAVLLLSISMAAPGIAQEKLIRLGTSHDSEYLPGPGGQSVTLMKDGRFAVVWIQLIPSPLFGGIAHVQYIRGDGSKALGPLGRAVTSSNLERATSVVAHAEEGVLVALERFDPDSGAIRLVVQRLDGGGRPRWHQGVYAAPVSRFEYQIGGALLASSDGGAFACFLRAAFVWPNANIFCQRFSADGRRLWGPRALQAVTTSSTEILEPPLAVADGNDGLLVFWQDVRPRRGPGTVTFRGQRFGPDGSRLWGDEGRIVYTRRLPGNYTLRPLTLVSDGSGGAILAFNDWPGPPSPIRTERVGIVQRVSGDGDNLWGSGGLVVTSGNQVLDSLIAGPDGGAFVGAVTYGSNDSLAFHRITADGRSIWPADGVPIVDPAVDQDDVQAFGSFNGGVLRLAWMHYVPVFRYEIRFGALDADGNRLAGAAGILLAPADSQKDLEGFAFNPETGTVFAAWVRYEPDDTDVHGAVYDWSRALTPAAQIDCP